jgi:hypothetical protein
VTESGHEPQSSVIFYDFVAAINFNGMQVMAAFEPERRDILLKFSFILMPYPSEVFIFLSKTWKPSN